MLSLFDCTVGEEKERGEAITFFVLRKRYALSFFSPTLIFMDYHLLHSFIHIFNSLINLM